MYHLAVNDIDSATILLDLRDALGDNPQAVPAITPRQRQVIQAHLVEDRCVADAAELLGIKKRSLLAGEAAALRNIMQYLEGVRSKRRREWRPWMKALLRDSSLSLAELAEKTGKTELAVKLKMSRLRANDEVIPFRYRTRRRAAKQRTEGPDVSASDTTKTA